MGDLMGRAWFIYSKMLLLWVIMSHLGSLWKVGALSVFLNKFKLVKGRCVT